MKRNLFGIFGTLTLGVALAGSALAGGAGAPPMHASAALRNAAGASAGSATLHTNARGELVVTVKVSGLTPGMHGVHVHAKGSCTPGPDDKGKIVNFGGAGGHFDPGMSHNHSSPTVSNKEGHGGDLPMVMVGADGRGSVTFTTERLSLRGDTGVLGRSIVVHAKADDYKTNPAGASGPRELCGVIR